ncbi:hypothetical protein CHUAL_008309 [Chamberlinius hualienensis]
MGLLKQILAFHLSFVCFFTACSSLKNSDFPPAQPTDCCDFEQNTCGFTSYGWQWSKDTPPPKHVASNSGNFIWTDQNNATAYTSIIYNISYISSFSFMYYIDTDDYAELKIYFVSLGGKPVEIATVSSYGAERGQWKYHWEQGGNTLLGPFPVDGYFLMKPSKANFDDPILIAVDEAQFNGACGSALPCCHFDNIFTCDFHNFGDDSNQVWKWTGNSTATYAFPDSGSDFLYFEVFDYSGPTVKTILTKPDIQVERNAVFKMNLFVDVIRKDGTSAFGIDTIAINDQCDSSQGTVHS